MCDEVTAYLGGCKFGVGGGGGGGGGGHVSFPFECPSLKGLIEHDAIISQVKTKVKSFFNK
jgi:hypothetical protein